MRKLCSLLLFGTVGLSAAHAQEVSLFAGLNFSLERSYGFETAANNVFVVAMADDSRKFIGEGSTDPDLGVFVGLKHKVGSRLSLKAKVEYISYFQSFLGYDGDEILPIFGPEIKVIGTSNPVINSSLRASGEILKVKDFHLAVLVGITMQFKLNNREADIVAGKPGEERIFHVLSNLDDSIKGKLMYYDYGISISYQRFALDLYYQRLFSNSYTGPIQFEGDSFDFINKRDFLNLQLSYTFLKFGK